MELNTTDKLILAKLREGRASPSYLAAELSKQQPYISQRLSGLIDTGCVVRVHWGLYGHAALEKTSVDATHIIETLDENELATASDIVEPTVDNSLEAEIASNHALGQTASDNFVLTSIVDQMALVDGQSEEQETTIVLREIYERLQETGEESQSSLSWYLDQSNCELPTRSFHQFWQFYLNDGEVLTRLPGVENMPSDKSIIRYKEV